MFLSDAAIRNRATVIVMMILIAVAGSYSYYTLPREAAPDVPIPLILITTTYEGVSPEDMETSVTMKMEQELSGLKGVKEITSVSAEGVSTIIIEFDPDIVIDDALQYVRDRVDLAKADLPTEAEEPFIKEINVAEFPFMMISISGGISPVRLKLIADELEERIKTLPGVLDVDVLGALEREIRLEIDRDRLASFNLTMPEVLALIPSQNVNVSAGGLETEGTKFNVRVPAEFVDPGEVDGLILTTRNGKPVFLTDVAKVVDSFKDRVGYARLDGRESITVSIRKRIGANIIPISDAVKAMLAAAEKEMPESVEIDIVLDVSKYIRMMVKDLENNLFSGLVLVLVVLISFLGFRTSAIVAFAIPMSMLMSFSAIVMLGYTLNMIVLFSLVMALGMLVDNAIVIVENIYRHMQLGYSRTDAAMKGAAEVAWPVATSTATTLAAFSTLIFWPGIMGDFMKYLPITLVITLSSSLFVALVISPTICSAVATGSVAQGGEDHIIIGTYRRLLETALAYWFATLPLAGLLLVMVVLLYAVFGSGVEFFPNMDPDRGMIKIRCPQGTNIRETDRIARIVEQRLEPFKDDIDYVVTNVGSAGGGVAFAFGSGASGPHEAILTLIFKDYEIREHPSAEVVKEIRAAVSDIAGAEISVEKEKEGPPTGAPVTVRITGRDFRELERLSEQAKRMIADTPGLVNLRSDYEASRPELVFRVDRRRAMLHGVSTAEIGGFLKTAIFGRKVGTYREYNDEYDITVRLPEADRVRIENLFSLKVPNAAGEAVPLSSLGEFGYQGGFGTISRVDERRAVTLTGDNEEGTNSNDVLKDARSRLDGRELTVRRGEIAGMNTRDDGLVSVKLRDETVVIGKLVEETEGSVRIAVPGLELPEGYEIAYAGEQEEQKEAEAFLLKAFVIALLLIVMILVAQFNSFTVPLVIMSSVILSLMGVLVSLLVLRRPFGIIMTGIGVISLAGIVVNNAIVLIAYTQQLQQRGRSLFDAAVEAGATRFRPVVLTAVTTILSLVPMATGVSYDFHKLSWVWRSQSSEWWRSMATAVIFGVAVATLLTLVVVPTLYVQLYRLATAMGFRGIEVDPEAAAAAEPPGVEA